MLEPSAPPAPAVTHGGLAAPTAASRAPATDAWQPGLWSLATGLLLAGIWVQSATDSRAWMRLLHQHPVLPDAIWANLTLLGFGWGILILVGTFDRRDGRAMLAAFFALVAGGLSVQLVKAAFNVARPALAMGLSDITVIGVPVLHSGSMPSGHAAAAGATATLLVLLLGQRQRLSPWLLAGIATLFTLVAVSRVAVGAHWPADVLVGSGLGVACGMLSWRIAGWLLSLASQPMAGTHALAASRHLRHRWLWMCSGDLLAAALCFGDNTGYPQAHGLQLALGVVAIGSALWRLQRWWRAGQRR